MAIGGAMPLYNLANPSCFTMLTIVLQMGMD